MSSTRVLRAGLRKVYAGAQGFGSVFKCILLGLFVALLPCADTRYLDTTRTGTWTKVANTNYGRRNYGTAVMYAPGKVLSVGGGGSTAGGAAPTKTAEIIDLNAATPGWKYVASMSLARRQLNATLLPDGTAGIVLSAAIPINNRTAGSVFPFSYTAHQCVADTAFPEPTNSPNASTRKSTTN